MDIWTQFGEIGSFSLEVVWIPVALWTALALLVMGLMRWSSHMHSLYQYHGRLALLMALPAGIFFSWLNRYIGSLGDGGLTTKFIVIQSPVTVTASSPAPGTEFNMLDPLLLAGLLTAAVALVALIRMAKVAADHMALRSFSAQLDKKPLGDLAELSRANRELAGSLDPGILTAFSADVEVPFTFGWMEAVIVLPENLQSAGADKLNMAIRHELMHVRHHDFMANNIIMLIRACFWFHPAVYKLQRDVREYRELSCDSEVLSDASISKKVYARLLLELAPKNTFSNTQAVSMAVDSSTLKKRIQTMTTQHNHPSLFRSSCYFLLLTTLLLTGAIACSDIQDSGITNRDIEQAQVQMETGMDKPLYVLNGEIVTDERVSKRLSRIKTKYIKSIEVLKGQKAIDKYGSSAKNGVIELSLLNRERAIEDLKESPSGTVSKADAKEDFFVVVEKMPELEGGLASLMSEIEYPEEARQKGIEGRVIVQFIVNEEGEVEDPTIVRGIGGGADEEALRVVSEADFKPGMQRGQPVRVQYSLPIIFKLGDNNTIRKEEASTYMESYKVEGRDMTVTDITLSDEGTLSGRVYDAATGEPLSGANVVLAPNSKGAATGSDGTFSFTGIDSENPEIRITYVGYESVVAEIR